MIKNNFRFFSLALPLLLLSFTSYGKPKFEVSGKWTLAEHVLTPVHQDTKLKGKPLHEAHLQTKLDIIIDRKRNFHFSHYGNYLNSPLLNKDKESFPFTLNKVNTVRRNFYKLKTIQSGKESHTESTFNEFYYKNDDGQTKVMVGRMSVEFGEGHTFNPINPFSIPDYFSVTSHVTQSNDGILFKAPSSDNLSVNIMIFGDEDLKTKSGGPARTVFIEAEHYYDPQNQFIYTIGEDQKRQHLGFEYKYSFEDGLFFLQGVTKTRRLDKKHDSEVLTFFISGFEKDITPFLTSRIEYGSLTIDEEITTAEDPSGFIPLEIFLSVINQVKISDKHSLDFSVIRSKSAKFTYLNSKYNYKISNPLEFNVFYNKTLELDTEQKEAAALTNLPMQFGAALSYIF